MSLPKYIVERGVPKSVPNCNTVEELQRYLKKVPHFEYRLVSAQFINGNFVIIWELRDAYSPIDRIQDA